VRLLALPLVLAAAPLAACVNTDTAVFVSPKILPSPALTVTKFSFGGVPSGTLLTGSFTLELHLGARAAGPSTVSMVDFSIDDPQGNSIVSPIPGVADMTFPLVIQPDTTTDIHFTIDTGMKPLPLADSDMTHLCAPAGVEIASAFNDSLAPPQTPVYSAVFNPTCM
jgi:hypothetical protein